MLVKLAFSISTAFPGQILLLDEFISAGDISFIEKARKRLLDYIDSAEILVVATHDLGLATQICTRAIILHKGKIIFDGKPESAVEIYRTMSDD
jgi:lipopolysaccharide transport system ATP-binding protein